MSYFDDVYKKRINRFGDTYATRTQGHREYEFKNQLEKKSAYYVNFTYNNSTCEGELIPSSQDEEGTIQHLLTETSLDLPCGAVLSITDQLNETNQWMIWWEKDAVARGYNRYTVLKMDTKVNIGNTELQGHFFGPQDAAMRDTFKQNIPIYMEDMNNYFFICQATSLIKKDVVFDIENSVEDQHFRVVGYDIQTIPGVEYVTLDPIYAKDTTAAPTKPEGDTSDDYYWLGGN